MTTKEKTYSCQSEAIQDFHNERKDKFYNKKNIYKALKS